MKYFEELRADFDTLGLDPSHKTCKPPVLTNSQLYVWLERASNALYYPAFRRNILDLEEEQLITDFGRDILRFCGLKHPIFPWSDKICEIAEGHVARSLVCDTVSNPKLPAPVIVTDDERAVGVLKQKGDTNYYALQDCERLDLYEQHFYQTGFMRSSFTKPLTAPHAWRIDVDEVRDQLYQKRFAGYRLPVEARHQIVPRTPAERATLSTTHEELVFRANLLLRDAEPINLKESE